MAYRECKKAIEFIKMMTGLNSNNERVYLYPWVNTEASDGDDDDIHKDTGMLTIINKYMIIYL